MADIKAKPIDQLQKWTPKELRKLRMTIRNRMESLKSEKNVKALPQNHPLKEMSFEQCDELLAKVMKAEKGNSL